MVGERILGRFAIESRLGSGGFGTVYRAWDERLHRAVAVKVVEYRDAGRVAREAQAAARLAHRNIAILYELAVENGKAYLVGELVEGSTLRELARRGRLSDRALAEIGADAAAALAHAHRHGVVHRDVKPENVLVPEAGGGAKLVDFGIARVAGAATLTATGAVLGTLAYMAPEQADGLRPGPTADVYSLALTLYECFAGEHPLARQGPAATARAIGEPIVALAEARPDLPLALTELIDECLDLDPERRPLASELEAALEGHAPDLSRDPLPPVAGPANATEAGTGVRWVRVEARVASAAALAAIVLAVLVWGGANALVAAIVPILTGVLALARPRAALAVASVGSASWLALGGDQPGAALVLIFLAAPLLLVPIEPGPALPLPALAPILGVLGLAGAYPAVAGLPRRAGERALLGATGYLWLAATEVLSGHDLFLAGMAPAPPDWAQSGGTAVGGAIGPLATGSVLLGAAVWALAALSLPLFVRGRFGILDLLGGILWTAALVTADRLLAGPGADPGGLLLVVAMAAATAGMVVRRARGRRHPVRLGPPADRLGGVERTSASAPGFPHVSYH